MLIPRNLKPTLLEAATDTPVVLVNGARQVGKSTLLKLLFWPESAPPYFNFDDLATLAAAKESPESFVRALPPRVLLDEIQRVPEILLAIKQVVDTNRMPGRFFLTGSANLLTLPKLSETLAGRMELHTLWPLSQGEIRGYRETFVDALFTDGKLPRVPTITEDKLLDSLLTGGYPESLQRQEGKRRSAWFSSYLTTILQRDVRDLSNIEGLTDLPDLLAILASRVGGLLNVSDLSRSCGIPHTTLKRYLTLLQSVFLVVELHPWFSNISKRLVKSPKVYLNDTGLVGHLLGIDRDQLARNRTQLGALLENFVVLELLKQLEWTQKQPRPYHFRTQTGQEVDIVLELPNGTICGVEVKATSSLSSDSLRGLKTLRDEVGARFQRGVVLYTGTETVAFAPDLVALPISALWEIADYERGYSCYGFRLGVREDAFHQQLQSRNLPPPTPAKTNHPESTRYFDIGYVPLVDAELKWNPTFRFGKTDSGYRLFKIEGRVIAPEKACLSKLAEAYGHPRKEGLGYRWDWGGTKITLLPDESSQLIYMTHDTLFDEVVQYWTGER